MKSGKGERGRGHSIENCMMITFCRGPETREKRFDSKDTLEPEPRSLFAVDWVLVSAGGLSEDEVLVSSEASFASCPTALVLALSPEVDSVGFLSAVALGAPSCCKFTLECMDGELGGAKDEEEASAVELGAEAAGQDLQLSEGRFERDFTQKRKSALKIRSPKLTRTSSLAWGPLMAASTAYTSAEKH